MSGVCGSPAPGDTCTPAAFLVMVMIKTELLWDTRV